MTQSIRHNRLIFPTIAIAFTAYLVHLLDSVVGNDILTAIGMFALAIVVLVTGYSVCDLVDDTLQPHFTLVAALIQGFSAMAVVYLTVYGPVGSGLSQIATGLVAAFGVCMWMLDITDSAFRKDMRRRQRQPRHGLSVLVRV